MDSSTLIVRLFDGTGQMFPAGTDVLLTVTDGNQKQIVRDDFTAASIELRNLPFYDNFGDNYSVIAYVDGYRQAGFAPVKLSPTSPLMSCSASVAGSTDLAEVTPPKPGRCFGWTWVGRPWWRSGVNREAKLPMLRYAFDAGGPPPPSRRAGSGSGT